MEGPVIDAWGPALWSIFHTLAERTGFRSTEVKEQEEKRLWRSLFMALRLTIPCPKCQRHYNEYLNKNPYHAFFLKKGNEWGTALRQYLWTFHNAVRQSKGQSIDFTIEGLEAYRGIGRGKLLEWKHIFGEHMRRGLAFHLLIRDDMIRVLRFIEELMFLFMI